MRRPFIFFHTVQQNGFSVPSAVTLFFHEFKTTWLSPCVLQMFVPVQPVYLWTRPSWNEKPCALSHLLHAPSRRGHCIKHKQSLKLWILPATSTMSPGTMSLALILWTLFLSWRYTFPISGSYSLSASMAFSAFRSWTIEIGKKTLKITYFHTHTHTQHLTGTRKRKMKTKRLFRYAVSVWAPLFKMDWWESNLYISKATNKK